MSRPSAFGPADSGQNGVTLGRISCVECRDEMELFIERVLSDPECAGRSRLREHLEMCAACSELYVQVLNLVSGPMIRPLLGQPRIARPEQLLGLCHLYRLQVGACNRWDDLNGLAVGLAVLGTIRRHEGDTSEAHRIQELALVRGRQSQNALSQAVSCLELGLLDSDGARLEEASSWAERLGDPEIKERASALHRTVRANASASRQKIYGSFFRGLLIPDYAAAAGGEKVLIVDNAREIPCEIVAWPMIDQSGELSLSLRIDPAWLDAQEKEFTIDLIFVPALEVFHSVKVSSKERWALRMAAGLELRCALPHFGEFRKILESVLPPGVRHWAFPRSALCLRIRLSS